MPLDTSIPFRAGEGRRRQDPMKETMNALAIHQYQGNALAQKENAELDKQLKELKLAREQTGAWNTLLGSVVDESSYHAAGDRARKMGLPGAESWEPQYSPDHIRSLQQSGLSFQDRVDGELRQRGVDLQEERFAWEKGKPGPLAEVYDANSPTGTTMVSRQDAVGRPGKPASGMSVTTGEDGTTVTMGRQGPAVDEFTKADQKARAGHFKAMREQSALAESARFRVRRARALLKQTDTGKTAGARLFLKSIAQDMGMDLASWGITDDVSAAEALRSIGTQFALDFTSSTSGAVSDAEMGMFMDAAVGLSNSNEGNDLILELADEVAKRQIDAQRLASQYVRENKRLDAGFDDVLARYHDSHPLFTDEMRARIEGTQGQALTDPNAAISIAKPLSEMSVEELQGLLGNTPSLGTSLGSPSAFGNQPGI